MKVFLTIIVCILILIIILLLICIKIIFGLLKEKNEHIGKVNRNFLFLNEWMDKKRDNPERMKNNLISKNCSRVAVYGAGYLGFQLYRELQKNSIEVVCFIDKSRTETCLDIPFYSLQDQMPDIDAIIISLVYSHNVIERDIKKVFKGEILFLEELI